MELIQVIGNVMNTTGRIVMQQKNKDFVLTNMFVAQIAGHDKLPFSFPPVPQQHLVIFV